MLSEVWNMKLLGIIREKVDFYDLTDPVFEEVSIKEMIKEMKSLMNKNDAQPYQKKVKIILFEWCL
jgi:hypothetical protein